MTQKFYWLCARIHDPEVDEPFFLDVATAYHPFQVGKLIKSGSKDPSQVDVTLLTWKEISKEEYDLFHKENKPNQHSRKLTK